MPVRSPANNFCHRVLGTAGPQLSLVGKEKNQEAEGVGRRNSTVPCICVLCSLTCSQSCGHFVPIIQTRSDLCEQMIKVVALSPRDLLDLPSLWSVLE